MYVFDMPSDLLSCAFSHQSCKNVYYIVFAEIVEDGQQNEEAFHLRT